MTRVVIDASVVVSWFLPDEKEGTHSGIFRKIGELDIHVPQIFYYELSNAFAMALRRGRVDIKTLSTILDIVWKLPIHLDSLDSFSVPLYFDSVIKTGLAHDLTVYDAAYLELAVRLGGVPLITYDHSLLNVAKKLKLKTKM